VSSRAISASSSSDAYPARDFFGLNVQNHPIWPALAATGAFSQPPPPKHAAAAPAGSQDGTSPAKEKVQLATPPQESRLAASHSGTLFLLVPPSPASTSQATGGNNGANMLAPASGASSRHSRLFFMDLKPLKTPNIQSRSEQLAAAARTPAFRELVCTPTPLPAHSHTLQLNSQGSYAAVHSTNTVYLVFLATNRLEKALMYAEPPAAATAGAATLTENVGVKVKCASVGSWFHQNKGSQLHGFTCAARDEGCSISTVLCSSVVSAIFLTFFFPPVCLFISKPCVFFLSLQPSKFCKCRSTL